MIEFIILNILNETNVFMVVVGIVVFIQKPFNAFYFASYFNLVLAFPKFIAKTLIS